MATVWQKSKGGVWYVSYREDGKQKNRPLRTTDKREALRLAREIDSLIAAGSQVRLMVSDKPAVQEKNPSFDEFERAFFEWANTHRSASAVEEYQVWLTQIREFTEAERLGDITPAHIKAFKRQLLRQGKRKPKGVGLDRVSVNNALKALQSIWNHSIKLGLYNGANPVVGIERLKVAQEKEKDYLTKEQVDALLDAAIKYADTKYVKRVEARNVYLAIALIGLAGLRKREVCFAKWDWVDVNRRLLAVRSHEAFTTKNRKSRVISMHTQLASILDSHIREEDYILECLRPAEDKAGYRADFKKSFKRVCEIAGIETTPHQLRHSFATRHAIAGKSLHVIAGWLGHFTTWVTQRYAHYQQTFNRQAPVFWSTSYESLVGSCDGSGHPTVWGLRRSRA